MGEMDWSTIPVGALAGFAGALWFHIIRAGIRTAQANAITPPPEQRDQSPLNDEQSANTPPHDSAITEDNDGR